MVVWLATWMSWIAVISLDYRRPPRDPRRLLPLAAVAVLAALTLGTMTALDLRLVLLACLACGVASTLVAAEWRAKRRRRRVESWATDHGYEHVAIPPRWSGDVLPEGLRRLPFLGGGRAATTSNLVRRELPEGGEVLVFDHAIQRPSAWHDPGGHLASGTVVAIRRPGLWLPLFQVRPAGVFRWMDGGPLGEAVAMPHAPSFAKAYRLGGHEPRNLRALFADDLSAALADRPGWLIEGEGEWVAAFSLDRPESSMSLKGASLRHFALNDRDIFAQEAVALLGRIADRGDRSAERGAGAA